VSSSNFVCITPCTYPITTVLDIMAIIVPSVLRQLVGRQEEHQASVNWLMRCWCGYLSGAMCRSSLASFKSKLVLCFWYWLTQAVLEKRPLNGCSSSTVVKTSQTWQSAQLHSGGYTATSDPERHQWLQWFEADTVKIHRTRLEWFNRLFKNTHKATTVQLTSGIVIRLFHIILTASQKYCL